MRWQPVNFFDLANELQHSTVTSKETHIDSREISVEHNIHDANLFLDLVLVLEDWSRREMFRTLSVQNWWETLWFWNAEDNFGWSAFVKAMRLDVCSFFYSTSPSTDFQIAKWIYRACLLSLSWFILSLFWLLESQNKASLVYSVAKPVLFFIRRARQRIVYDSFYKLRKYCLFSGATEPCTFQLNIYLRASILTPGRMLCCMLLVIKTCFSVYW